MRSRISAILILFVFLSFQFGKIASYIYCKWQAEVVQNKTDCGCTDHLLTMFDHNESEGNGLVAKSNLTEKITEFAPHFLRAELSNGSLLKSNFFTEYISPLADNFIAAPFHPPTA